MKNFILSDVAPKILRRSTSAPNDSLTFAEFFAGVGLVRLALERVGWRCVLANDIDPKKAEIYRQNFGENDLRVCDIRSLRARDIPRVSLVTASFPCTDLSLAGNRAGLAGHASGVFWPFANLLADLVKANRAPSTVLLENVTGFLTSHGGKDLHSAILALNDLGYACDIVLLDAVHFVPQSRPRLFVIASKGRLLRALRPLEAESPLRPASVERFILAHSDLQWGRLDLPPPPARRLSLADIIEDVPDASPLWWSSARTDHLIETMQPLHRARAEILREASAPTFATVYRRTRDGKTVAELRTDGVAGCLRTVRGGSSKQFLVVGAAGKLRARNMTPREYARLQGVPDSFRLDVPTNQALFGFGDAVCVPAVEWLAFRLLPLLHRRAA